MKNELETKENKIDIIEQTYKQEIMALNKKLNDFMMRDQVRSKSNNRGRRHSSKSRSADRGQITNNLANQKHSR